MSAPLRVCVFGSSSARTKPSYLAEARALGQLLAARGHVCVNGAGRFGGMGALNEGALAAGGTVEGVIHKMCESKIYIFSVFVCSFLSLRARTYTHSFLCHLKPNKTSLPPPSSHPACHPPVCPSVIGYSGMPEGGKKDELQGGLTSLLVADGPTLAQRKKMLCETADCFVILPGGPGTYDEMWEVISERQLELPSGKCPRPVVLVNVDGYWDPSLAQLQRCYDDGMLYKRPEEVVRAESTGEGALEWVVGEVARLRAEWDAKKSAEGAEGVSGIGDESRAMAAGEEGNNKL